MKKELVLALALISIAVATRLLPHWPNFTALGAAALFSGAFYKRKSFALVIPLLALFISDLVINNVVYASYFDGFQFFTAGFGFIYAGVAFAVLIGSYASISKSKPQNLALAGLSSALFFYLLTNFGAWLGSPLYAQNFGGLIASYVAGLPFLINGAIATLVYSFGIFGLHWYTSKDSLVSTVKG
jgi:hypothetical protein